MLFVSESKISTLLSHMKFVFDMFVTATVKSLQNSHFCKELTTILSIFGCKKYSLEDNGYPHIRPAQGDDMNQQAGDRQHFTYATGLLHE